jgi:hypothetical protein
VNPNRIAKTAHFGATKQSQEIQHPLVGSSELNAAVQRTVVANYLVQPVPSTRQPEEAYREVVPNGIAKTAHFRATKQNREILYPSVGSNALNAAAQRTVVVNSLCPPVPSTLQSEEASREVDLSGIVKTAHFRAKMPYQEFHHPSVGTSLLDVGGTIFLAAETPW